MGRSEVTFRKFAILSGVRQEAGDYAICVQPPTSNLQRRGTLMLMAEPAGLHASFGVDACRVAQSAVIEHYYGDHSLSLTSGLINALDSANNTLLQYNYEKSGDQGKNEPSVAVAVQGGGVATKKARVGLTAVLVRPDGAGIYIAQTAPAQLYIVHNGLLTAIPHPPGWEIEHQGPAKLVVEQEDADVEAVDEDLVIPSFQAAPLGSRPGVEADLIFRRVEAGDLIVAVSSGLAKRIERVTAERLFTEGDPDTIIETLHEMSMQLGVAEAHACVLQLGTEVRSGVETDFRSPLQAPHGGQIALNGGANIMPSGSAEKRVDLKSALSSPRKWLARRNNTDDSLGSVEGPRDTSHDMSGEEDGGAENKAITFSAHPTGTLLNRTVERPPFQIGQTSSTDEPSESDELEFDGWEDTPPALSLVEGAPDPELSTTADDNTSGRIIIKPSGRSDRPMTSGSGALQHSPYKVPTLFELADEEEETDASLTRIGPVRHSKSKTVSLVGIGRQTAGVLKTALIGLIPERTSTEDVTGASRPMIIPARVLIAAGVLVLSGLLLFSVLSMAAGGDKRATTNLLEQAKREDLLANQPNIPEVERKQHLAIALLKAKEARVANPQSNEAQLLVSNIQGKIDKSEGVTRLSQLKQLFDLAITEKNGAASTPGSTMEPPLAQVSGVLPLTTTVTSKQIVVQGNDAFILDGSAQKVYRCKIAAQNCAVVLSAGESVGGQKVGKLSNLTSRVTNVVALDDARVAYVFDPDSNAWQSQPLGDASKMQQPKDIATYDGNLYLLDAKQGQVSKYASGAYGEVPDDWIKDPASVAQLKDPITMAIDGVIYVALRDGKILAMQGGKVVRTISPKDTGSDAAPTDLFTGTDTRDLYLLRASEGSISKISKDGQTLSILKAPVANEELSTLDGMTVDEARGKLYLIVGTKVYEAQLPGPGATSAPLEGTKGTESKPLVRPTAEP